MRKFIIFLILLLNISSYSQEINKKEFKKYFQDAEYFFLFEDYSTALPIYLKIYEMDSTNANVNYRIGICYTEDKLNAHHAIKYLNKATQNISAKYRVGSYKERGAHFDCYKYLGRALQRDFEFDKAIEAFNKYELSLNVDNLSEIEITRKDIESCKNAKELLVQSALNYVKVDILSDKINSSYPDYSPVVSDDEQTMVFTSRRRYKLNAKKNIDVDEIDEINDVPDEFYMEDIYYSKFINNEWAKAEKITKQLNADEYTSVVSISRDGTKLFLLRKDILTAKEDEGNIYVSEFVDNKWTPMKKLNKNINTTKWETHAAISADGTKLYFSSERDGGYGGLDLYVSTIDENGEWGPAENLGSEVNSPFDDEYPFILRDGKTLYFSSQGHYNIGGHDIFYSTMNDAGEWTSPINLGYPINTMDDDIFFQPINNGKESYIAFETYEGMGGKDIYKLYISQSTFGDFGSQEFLSTKEDTLVFPMNLADLYRVNDRIDSSSIKEVIKYEDPSTETLPVATAIATNKVIIKGHIILADNNLTDTTFTLDILDPNVLKTKQRIIPEIETGKYVFKSLLNELTLEARGNGYKMATKKVIIPDDYSMPEMIVNITMYPIEVASGEYYKIKSIFFDYGKADLKRESQIELERLYELMNKNPSLYVEVIGFTDSKSSASFNKKLSEKRAKAAIDYLAEKGINVEHFVAKGMGEGNPIAINNNPDGSDNPEGRQLNRRVDIKLLNTDIANVVIEPVYVPENLAYKGSTRQTNNIHKEFYILLAVQKEKFTKNVECKYSEFKTSEGYVYTLGSFTDKSSAIKLLNKAIDNGFADSKIIDNAEYKSITKIKTKPIINSDNKKAVYSIQIKALSRPVKISKFTNIKGIKEYLGADGYYRYTYKEFKTKEEARNHLAEVTTKGYIDAFIIDVNKYKQRETNGNAEYTIQLKALKNPINIKFFSNLKAVKEFIANDGYYKYTIGNYKTMEEARKSLHNIKSKGYKDAFIVNVEKYN